ncbi:MAG TPA: hypothetical protein VIC26_04810 [Marinagarivorans sp.]
MSVVQESIRPLDGAIIDYCCAFFGRTLTLCWQDLPAQDRGSRQVLLNLKDYFLAALTNDFLGGVSAVDEVCEAPHWGGEQHGVAFLDALESALVRQCTEECALSLLDIQQRLRATDSYNEFAFDPRSIMAYVVAAVFKCQLNHLVGSALCFSFINRLGVTVPLFYSTLADVLKGYMPKPVSRLSPETPPSEMESNASGVESPATEIEQLTGYIQRFYTSNLYTHNCHSVLAALFQNLYATLLCYVRDSGDIPGKKSEMLRQVLQELYSLTELDGQVFERKPKVFERVSARLNAPEPYLWKTLKTVSEELAAFNRGQSRSVESYGRESDCFYAKTDDTHDLGGNDADLQGEVDPQGLPNDFLNLQMVRSVIEQDAFTSAPKAHHYARTSNVFHYAEHLVTEALKGYLVGEVASFIDRYWRHALLVTGLREGLDSAAWYDATSVLDELTQLQVMASADEKTQAIIIDRMRAMGKHYLSYNDFLEREEYLQAVDVLPNESWRNLGYRR